MRLHIIYNPNREGPEVRVHKAGCGDIARDLRGATSDIVEEHASEQDAAEEFYADFIAEESMTAADALAYTEFLPCTAGLPETSPEPEDGRPDKSALVETLAANAAKAETLAENIAKAETLAENIALVETLAQAYLAVAASEDPKLASSGTPVYDGAQRSLLGAIRIVYDLDHDEAHAVYLVFIQNGGDIADAVRLASVTRRRNTRGTGR